MANPIAKVQSDAPRQSGRGAPPPALSGETEVIFIIGDPVAQVKSPGLLTPLLAEAGRNAVVVPGHVGKDQVPAFMAGIAGLRNCPGLVITVPHKQAMLGYCARLTDRARYAQSVNVMRRTADGWVGDNTDGMGFVRGLQAEGGIVEGRRVLLVGAGGAGSAIGYEFLARGAAHLSVHDVDRVRRDGLIARLEAAFPGQLAAGSGDPTGFDIVANATPLGMRAGDPMPVQVDKLIAEQFAACPITRPEISPFIAAARAKGCATMAGAGMFNAQSGLLVEALQTLS